MILMYNETRTPWVVKVINDKAICLTKVKSYTRGEEIVKRSAHIFSYSNIFDVPEGVSMEDITKKFVNMNDVKILMGKSSSVTFSKKDFNPFITASDYLLKDICLISIDLKGRKIINVSHEDIFILENFILGGELTMIASLNAFDSALKIKLWDSETNTVNVYTFTCEGVVPCLVCSEEVPLGNEEEYVLYLRKFRPGRPTHTILALEKDLAKVNKAVDPERYNIITITADNTDEILKPLILDNHKAITLFTGKQLTKHSDIRYRELANILFTNFNLFYELFDNGKVFKSKI